MLDISLNRCSACSSCKSALLLNSFFFFLLYFSRSWICLLSIFLLSRFGVVFCFVVGERLIPYERRVQGRFRVVGRLWREGEVALTGGCCHMGVGYTNERVVGLTVM